MAQKVTDAQHCFVRPPMIPPLPLHVATAGKNHLKEEISNYPAPPHRERRAILPNLIKFRTSSVLAPMWTPPFNKSAKLTRGAPLVNSLLWGSKSVSRHGSWRLRKRHRLPVGVVWQQERKGSGTPRWCGNHPPGSAGQHTCAAVNSLHKK
jgi:hypothetical protein